MDISYTQRLINKLTEDGCYQLIPDSCFSETECINEMLQGFFDRSKGLGVALVCQDDDMDLERLHQLCADRTILVKDSLTDECSWQQGYYCYFASAENILVAFKKVIFCMKLLNKDVGKVEACLKFMEILSDDSDGFCERWWNKDLVVLLSSVLTSEELAGECADIRIVIQLPQCFFKVFGRNDCYFPSFLNMVIKGVPNLWKKQVYDNYHKLLNNIKTQYREKNMTIEHSEAQHILIDYTTNFAKEKNLGDFDELLMVDEFAELEKYVSEKNAENTFYRNASSHDTGDRTTGDEGRI